MSKELRHMKATQKPIPKGNMPYDFTPITFFKL